MLGPNIVQIVSAFINSRIIIMLMLIIILFIFRADCVSFLSLYLVPMLLPGVEKTSSIIFKNMVYQSIIPPLYLPTLWFLLWTMDCIWRHGCSDQPVQAMVACCCSVPNLPDTNTNNVKICMLVMLIVLPMSQMLNATHCSY